MDTSEKTLTWPVTERSDEITVTYVGRETLRRFSNVHRYNDWIIKEIGSHVGKRILEVGCGIGNITAYLLDRELVVGLDINAESVDYLEEIYPEHIFIRGDITDRTIARDLEPYEFDTVICINVLEHIEDDRLALEHMYKSLRPDGKAVLFVPAGGYLYGTLDRALGHYRRYTTESLKRCFVAAGFGILRLEYLNLAGIIGWWVNGQLLKRTILPEEQLNLFNVLAPLIIPAERFVRKLWNVPLGLSLVCVGVKK